MNASPIAAMPYASVGFAAPGQPVRAAADEAARRWADMKNNMA